MENDIKEIKQTTQQILQRVQQLEKSKEESSPSFIVPICTIQELKSFNEKLEDENILQKFIYWLDHIDVSTQERFSNAMALLFEKEVLVNINWNRDRTGKLVVADMKLFEVINQRWFTDDVVFKSWMMIEISKAHQQKKNIDSNTQ